MKFKRIIAFTFAVIFSLLLVNYKSIRDSINWHRQESLAEAASRGDMQGMKFWLRMGADINSCYSAMGCPLHVASSAGNTDAVRFLLDNGAGVNNRFKLGTTALMSAAYAGHADVVNLLLSRGANVALVDDNGTALDSAAETGHSEVVRLLLLSGAGKNRDDERALRRAIINNHADIVRLLLAHGVDVERKSEDVEAKIPSLLEVAKEYGNIEIINLLKEAGAKD